MGILVLICLGWLASSQCRRPFLLAWVYAGYALLTDIIFGAGVSTALWTSAIAFITSAAYFWLLERYVDSLALWFTILVGIPVLSVIVPLTLATG